MITMADEPQRVEVKPQAGPQTEFLSTQADICLYGGQAGSGKSFGILLDHLRWTGTPGYAGVIFRRTSPELDGSGSIWEEATGIFPAFGAQLRTGNPKRARFPSGALVEFRHLQLERDKLAHQGKQYALISFDEITQFTESQFWYLVSRNRSICGIKPYIRGTCNPDSDSWVREFIAWWIDPETGLAIHERSGQLRWMVRDPDDDSILWASDPDELPKNPGRVPMSVTFIAATLDDNPALLDKDPEYRDRLNAMPRKDRERLIGGNWNVSDDDGAEWPAEFFTEIWADDWPHAFELSCIAVDPSASGTGDFTAIVFVGLTGGKLFVDSDMTKRPASGVVPAAARMAIANEADSICFEDAGFQALLKPEFERYVKEMGVLPTPVSMLSHGGIKKEVRILRLSGRLQAHQIKLRKDGLGNKELLRQLRKTGIKGYHDDGPDALEMAIRRLNILARDAMTTAHDRQVVP